MLFAEPNNIRPAKFHDLFTGETLEEIKMIHGIRYHTKSPTGLVWSNEKITGPDTNDRLLLSDFNAERVFVVSASVEFEK